MPIQIISKFLNAKNKKGNLEIIKRETTHMLWILNKVISSFLIINFGVHKAVGQHVQSDKRK